MDSESLLDDLEAAECTYSYMEEEMRKLEAQGLCDEKWENLCRDMNAVQNEIAYLEDCLEDCDYE